MNEQINWQERAEKAEREVAGYQEMVQSNLETVDKFHREREEWKSRAEKAEANLARLAKYKEEDESVQGFISDLLDELDKLGIDTSNWDGDASCSYILAHCIASLARENHPRAEERDSLHMQRDQVLHLLNGGTLTIEQVTMSGLGEGVLIELNTTAHRLQSVTAERDALKASLAKIAAALRAHHANQLESCLVYFVDGPRSPRVSCSIATDLGEAYAESPLCEQTVEALRLAENAARKESA